MSELAPTLTAQAPHRRWRIAVLLGIGVLVNFFDRVNISVAYAALHANWGITAVTFGYLASAYNWSYAALQVPIGVMLDRWGVRRIGRVAALLWSMASCASGLAVGIYSFFAARLLLGVGEAPTFPANAKAVGYWFPERERSFATSLNDAAAKFASAIGVPILGLLVFRLGWRWSFLFTGFVSFLYFLLFWGVYRNPSEDARLTAEERQLLREGHAQPEAAPSSHAHGAPLLYLLRQPQVIGATIGFAAYNYVFYLVLTWLPNYLSMSLHVDLLHSAMDTSIPWLVATFTDLAIGGWMVDALVRRGARSWLVRQAVLVGGLAFGMGIYGARFAHTPAVALAWISLCMAGLGAMAPVGWSIPTFIAPRESVGRVGGIMNFATQIAAISAPVVTGYFARAHNFGGSFALAAMVLAIGIAGYVLGLGKLRVIPEPESC
ncbi:MAG TPA: MFS transporter [Acidobacteriaceae bacterium]|nr:MFS transporter [Acidobacteriaceae bacterium]